MVRIHADGKIEGPNQINEVDADLFDKFVGQPQAFAAF
jgi:hypothetical protein